MDRLTGVGVWAQELRYGEASEIPDAAAELEELGYSALWIPDMGGDLFGSITTLLSATKHVVIATGILNVWFHEPADVGAWWADLERSAQDRLLLGIGISHAPFIGDKWQNPLQVMGSYLDGLDDAGVPLDQVCLAALGPRMLDLAATRTAGAHPYLVDAAHTRVARQALSDGFLGVEQGVVLGDLEPGRVIARAQAGGYADLPNYANNWRRLGYSDEDITERSDRLIDGLVAIGDETTISNRVEEHFTAGADHVCLQVMAEAGSGMPREGWRRLAP
jgi:probable F420-dependent oxidoreductase